MRNWLLSIAMILGCACFAQQAQEAPAENAQKTRVEVDMTDPEAVVGAYLDACRRSDVDAALDLVTGDEEMIEALRLMSEQMLKSPAGVARYPQPPESQAEGGVSTNPRPGHTSFRPVRDGCSSFSRWRLPAKTLQSLPATAGTFC